MALSGFIKNPLRLPMMAQAGLFVVGIILLGLGSAQFAKLIHEDPEKYVVKYSKIAEDVYYVSTLAYAVTMICYYLAFTTRIYDTNVMDTIGSGILIYTGYIFTLMTLKNDLSMAGALMGSAVGTISAFFSAILSYALLPQDIEGDVPNLIV